MGLLPPLHPDVLQRRHGPRRRPVRERHQRHEERPKRRQASDTELTAEDLQEPRRRASSRSSPRTSPTSQCPACRSRWTVRRLPAGPHGCSCKPGHRGRLRQLEQPARRPLPQEEQDRRRPGHRRQRAVHGVRQQGRDSSATGVAFTRNPANGHEGVLRRLPGQRPGRGRCGRHPQHRAHRRPRRRSRASKRPASSSRRSSSCSRTTSATCATSSSPSSRASCGCCRPASASAPPRPRSPSPSQFETEGLPSPSEEAVMRVAPDQLDQLLHPQFDTNGRLRRPRPRPERLPGRRRGRGRLLRRRGRRPPAEAGRKCVLVRWETNPDDLAGMVAAEGILTSHGGKTSHAAVIARGMGAPCVCGAEALKIDAEAKEVTVSGTDVVLRRGRHHLHRRHHRRSSSSAPCRPGASPSSPATSRPSWSGPTRFVATPPAAASSASAPTPTTPRTPSCPATSAPRASACAAPSTCSWATASEIIQTFILADRTGATAAGRSASCSKAPDATTSSACSRPWTARRSIVRLLDPPLHEFLDSPRELRRRARPTPRTGGDERHPARGTSRPSRPPGRLRRRPTPCSACAAAVSASSTPSSPRCRFAPSRTAAAHLKKRGFDPQARDHGPPRRNRRRSSRSSASRSRASSPASPSRPASSSTSPWAA